MQHTQLQEPILGLDEAKDSFHMMQSKKCLTGDPQYMKPHVETNVAGAFPQIA